MLQSKIHPLASTPGCSTFDPSEHRFGLVRCSDPRAAENPAIKTVSEGSIMYAVIKTGGKQYKVAAGETLKIERLAGDVGADVTLDQVLAMGSGADLVTGSPLVTGASVLASIVSHGRHEKVRIFKMKKRKHYQKRQGHRQSFTEIRISAINAV